MELGIKQPPVPEDLLGQNKNCRELELATQTIQSEKSEYDDLARERQWLLS